MQNTKRKLRSKIARESPEHDVRKISQGATGRTEVDSRQCCNRIRSPGNVNKIRLEQTVLASRLHCTTRRVIRCTPFRRRRIKHHCSIKHHTPLDCDWSRGHRLWGTDYWLFVVVARFPTAYVLVHAARRRILVRSRITIGIRPVHSRDNSEIKFRRVRMAT